MEMRRLPFFSLSVRVALLGWPCRSLTETSIGWVPAAAALFRRWVLIVVLRAWWAETGVNGVVVDSPAALGSTSVWSPLEACWATAAQIELPTIFRTPSSRTIRWYPDRFCSQSTGCDAVCV